MLAILAHPSTEGILPDLHCCSNPIIDEDYDAWPHLLGPYKKIKLLRLTLTGSANLRCHFVSLGSSFSLML